MWSSTNLCNSRDSHTCSELEISADGEMYTGSSANAKNQGLVSLIVDWQVSERDFERKVDFVLHISLFSSVLDLPC